MGVLRIMSAQGDTAVTWNPANAEEVAVARETFDANKLKGFMAYKVLAVGERAALPSQVKGEVIRTFDPQVEEIVQTVPMVGG